MINVELTPTIQGQDITHKINLTIKHVSVIQTIYWLPHTTSTTTTNVAVIAADSIAFATARMQWDAKENI